jgi:hypothetical protein
MHRPVTIRTENRSWQVESLTYAALGHRLGCSPEAVRAVAKRLRLPRQKANDGKALVVVDLTEIEHKPLPAGSRVGHPARDGNWYWREYQFGAADVMAGFFPPRRRHCGRVREYLREGK